MNQHRIHPPDDTAEEGRHVTLKRSQASVPDVGAPSVLDVGRCPKCDGPMTARNGPRGPYFHCLCFERARAVLKFETKDDPRHAAGQTSQKPVPDSVPAAGELLSTPG